MAKVILGRYKGIRVPQNLTDKEKEDYVIEEILVHSTVKVSEKEVTERARRMAEEYALRLTQQGLSIEQYYGASNTDEKALVSKMKELAKKQLRKRMLLEEIAEKEGITATEEELEKKKKKLTIRYPLGKEEIKKVMQGEEEVRLRNEIVIKKAVDFLVEQTKKCEVT